MGSALDSERAADSTSVIAAPQITQLCVDASGLAHLLDVSTRQVYRMADGGRLPAALEFGGCKRWSLREIESWIAAGAPRRKDWEAKRQITPCAPLH